MNYVYIRSEPGVYTVGFFAPDGKWEPESDHNTSDEAALRVRSLNGDGDRSSELPGRVVALCKKRDWSLHWTCRGSYLHLESSELIEAVRGKRGDKLEEAADVLIVLMSITGSNGMAWDSVVSKAFEKVAHLESAPQYEGEEFNSPIDRASQAKAKE